MITIDGSYGEGGGQILRSSLTLSLLTSIPFAIKNIRATRDKPGLLRQHLTAVKAAQTISRAKVKGDEIRSSHLIFEPGAVQSGHYQFAVGTAGSTTLVLQTILPALLTIKGQSQLILEGGTHNPYAPPYDFLQKVFFPLLNRMGAKINSEIKSYGFYPAGGGRIVVDIFPVSRLNPIELLTRGKITGQSAWACSSKLSPRIGEQEMIIISRALKLKKEEYSNQIVASPGPGNVVMVYLQSEQSNQLFIGFGAKGKPLEQVCEELLSQVESDLQANVPVDPYLADQILILLAMAGRGRFRTSRPTLHTLTNIKVIEQFLAIQITCQQVSEKVWEIIIQ